MNHPHVIRTYDISKAAGELARTVYGVNIAGGKKSHVKLPRNRQHEETFPLREVFKGRGEEEREVGENEGSREGAGK